MKLFPNKKQWSSWLLPSKLTAIGAYAGVIGVILSVIFFFFSNSTNNWNNQSSISEASKQSPSIRSEAPTKDTDTKETLHDYFKTDLGGKYFIHDKRLKIGNLHCDSFPSDHQDHEIEFRLYYNFESNTKFLSFFIPSSTYPNSECICSAVAENVSEILKLFSDSVIVAGSQHTDRLTDGRNMKFSGRIYIYNETYIRSKNIDLLRDFYKTNDLDPVFRGTNYLARRMIDGSGEADDK